MKTKLATAGTALICLTLSACGAVLDVSDCLHDSVFGPRYGPNLPMGTLRRNFWTGDIYLDRSDWHWPKEETQPSQPATTTQNQ